MSDFFEEPCQSDHCPQEEQEDVNEPYANLLNRNQDQIFNLDETIARLRQMTDFLEELKETFNNNIPNSLSLLSQSEVISAANVPVSCEPAHVSWNNEELPVANTSDANEFRSPKHSSVESDLMIVKEEYSNPRSEQQLPASTISANLYVPNSHEKVEGVLQRCSKCERTSHQQSISKESQKEYSEVLDPHRTALSMSGLESRQKERNTGIFSEKILAYTSTGTQVGAPKVKRARFENSPETPEYEKVTETQLVKGKSRVRNDREVPSSRKKNYLNQETNFPNKLKYVMEIACGRTSPKCNMHASTPPLSQASSASISGTQHVAPSSTQHRRGCATCNTSKLRNRISNAFLYSE